MVPRFKKHLALWNQVERLLIAAMLYHSDSITDLNKFLHFDEDAKETAEDKERELIREQLVTIGR